MDLLGDIGTTDQLTSARSEIAVLQEKVKELSVRVKELVIENECLKAEVEMYRSDAMTNGMNELTVKDNNNNNNDNKNMTMIMSTDSDEKNCDDFIRSGDGTYPSTIEVTLPKLHGAANPLCCSLSKDDRILATGGADSYLSLCLWGLATTTTTPVMDSALRIRCDAPVICCTFAQSLNLENIIAVGCMDGSVQLIHYQIPTTTTMTTTTTAMTVPSILPGHMMTTNGGCSDGTVRGVPVTKHGKYVKVMDWSKKQPNVLASASADGTVHICKVQIISSSNNQCALEHPSSSSLRVEPMETLHLQGPVESMCFIEDSLCCYARGTSYISCFDISSSSSQGFRQSKIHLNQTDYNPTTKTMPSPYYGTNHPNNTNATTGTGDDHVSFCVMDMKPWTHHHHHHHHADTTKSYSYLALATDTSRNIIIHFASGKIIRNLYGHSNDSYSQPKLAWSQNGQYLMGNTQDDSVICVWDIASSKIVQRLKNNPNPNPTTTTTTTTTTTMGHTQTIRDMFSSSTTNTLVTTSFDKQTNIWFFTNNDNYNNDTDTNMVMMG